MKITCPNCGQEYELKNDLYGRKVECAKCNNIFHITESCITLEEVIEVLNNNTSTKNLTNKENTHTNQKNNIDHEQIKRCIHCKELFAGVIPVCPNCGKIYNKPIVKKKNTNLCTGKYHQIEKVSLKRNTNLQEKDIQVDLKGKKIESEDCNNKINEAKVSVEKVDNENEKFLYNKYLKNIINAGKWSFYLGIYLIVVGIIYVPITHYYFYQSISSFRYINKDIFFFAVIILILWNTISGFISLYFGRKIIKSKGNTTINLTVVLILYFAMVIFCLSMGALRISVVVSLFVVYLMIKAILSSVKIKKYAKKDNFSKEDNKKSINSFSIKENLNKEKINNTNSLDIQKTSITILEKIKIKQIIGLVIVIIILICAYTIKFNYKLYVPDSALNELELIKKEYNESLLFYDGTGRYYLEFYNPTEYTIHNVKIRLIAHNDWNKKKIFDRIYDISSYLPSHQEGTIRIEFSSSQMPGSFEYKILKAYKTVRKSNIFSWIYHKTTNTI